MWNIPIPALCGFTRNHSSAPFISSQISSFQKMSFLMTWSLACLIGPVNYVIGAGTVSIGPKGNSSPVTMGWAEREEVRKVSEWLGGPQREENRLRRWMLSLLCRMLTHKLYGTCFCSMLFSIRDWVVDKMGHGWRMMCIIHVAQLGWMKCPWETVPGLCLTHWASL